MNEFRTIDISTATILKILAAVVAIVFLYAVREIVMILLFAIVIASGVNAPVAWLQRRGLPRTVGVLIVYLAFFAFLGTVLYFAVPPFVTEVHQFAQAFPAYLRELFGSFTGFTGQTLEGALKLLGERLGGATQGVFATTSRVVGGVASTIIILVLSIYLSVRERGIEEFLRLVTPERHEEYVIRLWARAQHKMGRWLQGQLLLGLIVGLMIYIGLFFLGLPYRLTLAVLMGVFELVPIVGPILGAIPAVIIAFFVSPFLAVGTVVLYTLVQQFENHVLVPIVTNRIVGLNPVIVILALLVGAKLGGIPGMVLSVPLAAALAEYFGDVTRHRKPAPAFDAPSPPHA